MVLPLWDDVAVGAADCVSVLIELWSTVDGVVWIWLLDGFVLVPSVLEVVVVPVFSGDDSLATVSSGVSGSPGN